MNFAWGMGMGPGMGGGRRRFKRGMLKWVVLKMLESRASHGYDFMRWFREGGWAPGAGSIYPLLANLEENGLIEGRDEDGKRVYTITDKGRDYLREHAPFIDLERIFESQPAGEDERQDDARAAFSRLDAACTQAQRTARPESLKKISQILDRARKEIYTILADE